MPKVLVLLAAAGDEKYTEQGQSLLRDFHISYHMRVVSAQMAPDLVREVVSAFLKDGGQLIVCLAHPRDYLASLVSSLTDRPVLCVAVGENNFLLEGLPGTIPLAHIGVGAAGFAQAALFALQLLALADAELYENVKRYRHSLAAQTRAVDQKHRVIFDGQKKSSGD